MTRTVAAMFALVFVAQIAGWAFVNGESSDRRHVTRLEQVAACGRGNLVRANEMIDTRDPDDTQAERARVRVLFPLLDCEASRRGVTVKLAAREAQRFLGIVELARVPVVRGGRVVGHRAP